MTRGKTRANWSRNSAGAYSYTYDDLGEKTQQIWTDADGDSLTIDYCYDTSGNMTLKTDSQGNTTSYAYNSEGLITSEVVTSNTGAVARTDFSYNADQQITQVSDYTVATGGTPSLVVDYTYDLNGNLTTEIETGSGGTVLVSYVNTYDADNRITSEDRNGTSTTYTYDSESQVTSAGSQSNSFDANGNLTNSGFTTGTYNEITSDGTWDYSYDAVGNLVEKIDTTTGEYWVYSYDFNNRMTEAVDYAYSGSVTQSVFFAYDVFGNLVEKTVTNSSGSTTQKFAYEGNNIYADLDSSGNVVTLYVAGAGGGTLYGRVQAGRYIGSFKITNTKGRYAR